MLTAVQARMRRSGPGWVGGYVMDGRDTVIGACLSKVWIVADQTRAAGTQEGSWE